LPAAYWLAGIFIKNKETDMMTTRRLLLGLFASTALLAGCAGWPTGEQTQPIVFVHGNGDSAAVWQTTIWRF
jgi:pimeloyl-ACP methyl ester carboxylesterase